MSLKYSQMNTIVRSSQSDEVDGLAVHHLVAGVDLLVPGLRCVIVENRHPAFGKLEMEEVADKLRGRFGRREVALHLELHGVAELPELHAEVETLRAERHLAGDAHDPRQPFKRRQHVVLVWETRPRDVEAFLHGVYYTILQHSVRYFFGLPFADCVPFVLAVATFFPRLPAVFFATPTLVVAVFFAATFLVANFLMVDFAVVFFLAGEVFFLPPFALGATAAALPRYVIFK